MSFFGDIFAGKAEQKAAEYYAKIIESNKTIISLKNKLSNSTNKIKKMQSEINQLQKINANIISKEIKNQVQKIDSDVITKEIKNQVKSKIQEIKSDNLSNF